jgi:hypothetical protein
MHEFAGADQHQCWASSVSAGCRHRQIIVAACTPLTSAAVAAGGAPHGGDAQAVKDSSRCTESGTSHGLSNLSSADGSNYCHSTPPQRSLLLSCKPYASIPAGDDDDDDAASMEVDIDSAQVASPPTLLSCEQACTVLELLLPATQTASLAELSLALGTPLSQQ